MELKIRHLSMREQFLLTAVFTSLKVVGGETLATETINYAVQKTDMLYPKRVRAPSASKEQ